MLAELMRLRYGIAVAGSHGKTTTTSMIALVLEHAGLDPTAVIGGRLSAFGSNARLGRGDYMVAEADESDRSFLRLSPAIAVVTNVDREHLEAYGTFEQMVDAFREFVNKVPFYGAVVLCADDPHLAALLPAIDRRVITYAVNADADLVARDARFAPLGSRALVVGRPRRGAVRAPLGELSMRVPGRHNLLNALAAVAVGLEVGIGFDRIARALGDFVGAERRFQVWGEPAGVMVVDDYGHHPTEIAAVLDAARGLRRRTIVAFQPHRYSRTLALMEEFGRALAPADEIVLTDIYAAGEDPLPGATLDALAAAVRRHTSRPLHVVPRVEELPAALAAFARRGDLVITLGAGSIGVVPGRLVDALSARGEG
jgi:UDP-N-acetylmuramate--alanine ligase